MRPARVLLLVIVACTTREPVVEDPYADPATWQQDVSLQIVQQEGEVHWVEPAQRELGPDAFGTPRDPRALALVPPATEETVAALLERYPILIGLPLDLRGISPDLTRWTRTTVDVPFGGPLHRVPGTLTIAARDRLVADPDGPYDLTADRATAVATFDDPEGRSYRVVLDQVIVPPFPGWDTGGGVLHDQLIHGEAITGSPLLPTVHAWLAVWGLADVYIDGLLASSRRLTALEVIETVRDSSGRLVQSQELPLNVADTLSGHPFQAHLIVFPVRFGARGPVFDPVDVPMQTTFGKRQDFLHVVWERPRIVDGPPWRPRRETGPVDLGGPTNGGRDVPGMRLGNSRRPRAPGWK